MTDWWLAGFGWGSGTIDWQGEPWLVGLVGAVCLVAWAIALFGPRAQGGRRGLRVVEGIGWTLALAVVVLAFAEPVQVEEEGREEAGRMLVLVDGSASMGVHHRGESRGAQVQELLAQLRREHTDLEIYTFDENLRSGAPETFDGRGTDLAAALDAIADRHLGQSLRGIVVITDGVDLGRLRADLTTAAESGDLRPGLAPSLPGPLTLVQVGASGQLEDLAVESVVSGGFAFLRTPFTLTAVIRGAPGRSVPVSLHREQRLVEERTVQLDAEGGAEVRFEITPRQTGRFAWEVSVPTSAADAVPGNNAFPVVVRVVRERMRVLQVSGSPSYDQKFLRLFLKEDPSVDLVSFFILRTREDFRSGWSADELSLIEFPYERLFTEDLDTFDLVVLQNFNYRPYFSYGRDDLLQNIATYVREGGALVMTGGDRSFDLGDYARTPIAEVLPVELGVTGVKTDEAPFRPMLTQAGAVHPLTRLGATEEETRATWNRLAMMDGTNRTLGLAKESAALLVHPGLTENQDPLPILAVREVGEGRTLALTVDSSWRWSFSEAAEGRGNQAYLRFWKNAMRWLVADPDDRRVVITPSRENVLLGDGVRLTVKVRDAGYGPVEGARITGAVVTPSGRTHDIELVTEASGEAATLFEPQERGAHRVQVSVGDRATDRGETVFAVSNRDPELARIEPDEGFLRALAKVYGERGRYVAPGAPVTPLVDDAATRTVPERSEKPLSTAPLIGLLFGLFAGIAWFARRRSGGV